MSGTNNSRGVIPLYFDGGTFIHQRVQNAGAFPPAGLAPVQVVIAMAYSLTTAGNESPIVNVLNSSDGLGADTEYPGAVAFNMGFNGASWDRVHCGNNNADGVASLTSGVVSVASYGSLFNGATWDRARSQANNADAVAVLTAGVQSEASYDYLFNGTSWDRSYSASAATQAAAVKVGLTAVATPGCWTLTSAPAVNTQATATKAAGAAGKVHVLTSIQASVNAVVAQATPVTIVVRDGATGAGTILWQDRITATIGTDGRIGITGLSIVGSAATAMTVEFTAVPAVGNFETVSATGYTVG